MWQGLLVYIDAKFIRGAINIAPKQNYFENILRQVWLTLCKATHISCRLTLSKRQAHLTITICGSII